MMSELKFQAISPMKKPLLSNENFIDFGIKELFTQNFYNITIVNPSDVPLEFSFFLGSEDYLNFDYTREEMKKIIGSKNERIIICLRNELFKKNWILKRFFSAKANEIFLEKHDEYDLYLKDKSFFVIFFLRF